MSGGLQPSQVDADYDRHPPAVRRPGSGSSPTAMSICPDPLRRRTQYQLSSATSNAATATVIVHARTRDLAIARMRRALEVMVVEGIKTTIPLHQRIMADPNFQAGNFSTKFMEEFKYEV